MKKVIRIFGSAKKKNDLELKTEDNLDFLGNGFFISNNGTIATVWHIFENNYYYYYALLENKFYEIINIDRGNKDKNVDYIDIAICKINLCKNVSFFNLNTSEKIIAPDHIRLAGFSRYIKRENIINNSPEFVELTSVCSSNSYHNIDKIEKIHSFSFFLKNDNFKGLSGSPIINDRNNIVGIFKAGITNGGKYTNCQAIHIDFYKSIFKL